MASMSTAQSLVVPATRTAMDGTSGGALAGVEQRFRMQVLLDGAALGPLPGHSITDLAFRRDGQHLAAQQGGRVQATVRMSTTARPSSAASPRFRDNHGADEREVFSGEIVVPTSPALANRDGAQWTAPDAVVFALRDPFPYQSGTLCVELAAAPVSGSASPWWRIDYELFWHDAQVAATGAACDPLSNAFASRNTLLPGGSLDLICSGPRGATGVLLLGTTPITPALSLDFLGAPDCYAGVVPAAAVAAPIQGGPVTERAAANLTLDLPCESWLAGGQILAQWAVFPNPRNPALLTTTKVLSLQIASSPSTLPGTLVRTGPLGNTEPWPAVGRVYPQLMPVVRLGYQ
ncbi:MAG TPA: hypothetical protein VK081_00310 [Planctomycetota bacterium]|nr:hypothetical protein [Planctomycetota bacterium]